MAHEAACRNCLSEDFNQFNQWESAANRYGRTVAHIGADLGYLPKDFDQWHLKNSKGETVFETMLSNGGLLKWFNDWDLVITDDGETCKEIYERIKKK